MPADLERWIFVRHGNGGVRAGLGEHERGSVECALAMGVKNGVVDRDAHAEIVGDKNNLLGHDAEIL